MKYKLITIDLDGTLLKTHNTITSKNFKALKNFADAGGQIVISTGRAISSARKIANQIEKHIGAKIPYIITLCGSMIYDHKNKIVYQKIIDPNTTKQIADLVKKLKLNIWIYQKNFETKSVYSKSLILSFVAKIAKNINLKKINFSKAWIPAWKINVFGFNIVGWKKFEKIINSKLSNKVSLHKTNKFICELTPVGCSKGEAIKIISKKLNIPLNQVASIGDSGNDLSAAEVSRCFGAIGGNKLIKSYSSENYPRLSSQVAKFINKRLLSRNPEIKLIASDLDGTILNEKKLLNNNFCNEIKEFFHDKTPILTFATGRSVNDVYRIINNSGLRNENIRYVVANNGAIIYDFHKLKSIKYWSIPKKTAKNLLKLVADFSNNNKFGKLSCYIYTYDKKEIKQSIITTSKYQPKIYAYVQNFNDVTSTKNFLFSEEISKSFKIIHTNDLPNGIPIMKFLIFFTDTNQRNKFISKIKQLHLKLNISMSSSVNIEINAPFVSKGFALKKLAKILKLKNTELLTIGDQKNDITMLKLTEWSFTFNNSQEEVQSAARYLIKHDKQNPIVNALKIYRRDINND